MILLQASPKKLARPHEKTDNQLNVALNWQNTTGGRQALAVAGRVSIHKISLCPRASPKRAGRVTDSLRDQFQTRIQNQLVCNGGAVKPARQPRGNGKILARVNSVDAVRSSLFICNITKLRNYNLVVTDQCEPVRRQRKLSSSPYVRNRFQARA